MGSQRVRHGLVNEQQQIPYDYTVEVTNRFKGLDLVDSAWRTRMEICITVQEVVTKIIPKKKEMHKGKMVI